MNNKNELTGISRRAQIYELLKETLTVNVKELAAKYGVSDMTIRRDLHIMEDQGIQISHVGKA